MSIVPKCVEISCNEVLCSLHNVYDIDQENCQSVKNGFIMTCIHHNLQVWCIEQNLKWPSHPEPEIIVSLQSTSSWTEQTKDVTLLCEGKSWRTCILVTIKCYAEDMGVLGFDETSCPELPWPSKEKHRKAADAAWRAHKQCFLYKWQNFRNFAKVFQKMAKQQKNKKKQKFLWFWRIFASFFDIKIIKLATSRIRVVFFGGETSQLVDFRFSENETKKT